MPNYRIEQYEIHCHAYTVTADDEADAVAALFRGDAEPIDNSLEYVEIADERGMSVNDNRNLADQLFSRGLIFTGDEVIPSVRTIREIKQETNEP